MKTLFFEEYEEKNMDCAWFKALSLERFGILEKNLFIPFKNWRRPSFEQKSWQYILAQTNT